MVIVIGNRVSRVQILNKAIRFSLPAILSFPIYPCYIWLCFMAYQLLKVI